jgi:hypothetical protein
MTMTTTTRKGKGVGAGWHLKEVLIDAPKLGKKWRFAANRWLDKGEADGKTEIDLEPSEMSYEEYNPCLSIQHLHRSLFFFLNL